MNKFLSYFSLIAVFGWLLFSYLPTGTAKPVQLSFPLAASPLLQWIAAIILVGFVLIQLILIRSAVAIGRANEAGQESPLNVSSDGSSSAGAAIGTTWEVIWTVLPLLMVIGIAAVGYRLWSGL